MTNMTETINLNQLPMLGNLRHWTDVFMALWTRLRPWRFVYLLLEPATPIAMLSPTHELLVRRGIDHVFIGIIKVLDNTESLVFKASRHPQPSPQCRSVALSPRAARCTSVASPS